MSSLKNPNPTVLSTPIKLFRYWNFRSIVETISNSKAAEMLGCYTSYVSLIAADVPKRAIGNDMAQTIERVFRLPPGRLDQEPSVVINHESEKVAEVARIMQMASPLDQELILDMVRRICGHSIGIIQHLESPPEGKQRIITAEQVAELDASVKTSPPA